MGQAGALLFLAFVAACGGGSSAPTSPSSPVQAPSPSPSPAPPPTIVAISPTAGSTAGGTTVTITGTGFQPGASVNAGGTAANATVANSTSITATMPAHAEGVVDLAVTNPGGLTGRLPGAFRYECPLDAPTNLRAGVFTSSPLRVILLWSAVPNATSYVFEVGTAPVTAETSPRNPTFTEEGTLTSGVIGTGTFTGPLQPGTSYFLRVRAKSACGVGPVSAELRRDYQ